jgi:xylulose-5-phosphate/fructose-6-phosphate phosphoketolase
MSDEQLSSLFTGYGYKPYFIEGDEPESMHQLMAGTLDSVIDEIKRIQSEARTGRASASASLPTWPVIILRTPKGWTGPKIVDGQQVEGHTAPIRYRSIRSGLIQNT